MRGIGILMLSVSVAVVSIGGGALVYYRSRSQSPVASPARKTAKTPAAAPGKPILPARPAPRPSPIRFADVTKPMGLDFVAFSGTTPEKHFPTANGTGVGMIDFDQDGWLDLYFANACRLDGVSESPPNAMFRSRAGQAFERVAESSCADVTGFTQGVAAGDFNNDGFPDLYLVRYGPDILLKNNGDGTFHDCTDSAGGGDPRWGTSAAFLDYDGDGALDFYVANYGKWDSGWHAQHRCGQDNPPVRIYCSPKSLDPEVHGLYHSLGDGTFVDVAEDLGIARTGGAPDRSGGRGQGVVAADVNNDGHTDIYVANDLNANFLFINTGRGTFEDHTESSCAAFNGEGREEAGMGTDACDVDGDGLAELFVTNFYLEHNTLYQNLGKNLFHDVSHWSGVAADSMHFVGWGTALEDFDGDGWPDIFVVNGHVDDNLAQLGRDEPYAQKPGLWRNAGKGRFEKVHVGTGDYFDTPHVSRGAAFGDVNNDGAVDVVVSCKDGPAIVLRNDSRAVSENTGHAWIQLQLIGSQSNRDAIGAAVECHVGPAVIRRQIKGGRSYLSAHDLRLSIGLGATEAIDRLVIRWPSGKTQELEGLALRQVHRLREPR